MTEAEWLTATNPWTMLALIENKASEQKLRRYAVEAIRPHIERLSEATSRQAFATAERAVVSRVTITELMDSREQAWISFPESASPSEADIAAARASGFAVEPDARVAAEMTTDSIVNLHGYVSQEGASEEDIPQAFERGAEAGQAILVALLRDIFGNPFRPVAVDPAWLTEAAVGIARGIYDDRAFERMPILADALQEAGCEDAELLAHCREPGTHVRGCWVVDLVLGKS